MDNDIVKRLPKTISQKAGKLRLWAVVATCFISSAKRNTIAELPRMILEMYKSMAVSSLRKPRHIPQCSTEKYAGREQHQLLLQNVLFYVFLNSCGSWLSLRSDGFIPWGF